MLDNAASINNDHHLVIFAHYELGLLYAAMGSYFKAADQYEFVLSGKNAGVANKVGKGKLSLQVRFDLSFSRLVRLFALVLTTRLHDDRTCVCFDRMRR